MKQLYRWVICLLLVHTAMVPIRANNAIPTDNPLKFGVKLGYACGCYLIEDFFGSFVPGLFVTYHFRTIDQAPHLPLFGFWGTVINAMHYKLGLLISLYMCMLLETI